MEKYPSFTCQAKMIQKNFHDEKIQGLEEIFKDAQRAEPVFQSLMTNIALSIGLDPTEEIKVDGEVLMLDKCTRFKVLTLCGLKSRDRCIEKASNEYGGDYAKLVDIVRCSIVVYTEDQLELVASALDALKSNPNFEVIRLKNRFKSPLFNGYRDALYSIVVYGEGFSHVCELQLHLAGFVVHNKLTHVYYEYFRSYFNGSDAVEKRMKVLLQIRGFDRDVDRMLASVLSGSDIEQLKMMADLVGNLMGDFQIAAQIWKRVLELEDSPEFKDRYANALKRQGKLKEAEKLCREVVAAYKKQDHPATPLAIVNLGLVLKDRGNLAEAEVLNRQALKAYRDQLGEAPPDVFMSFNIFGAHPDTLMSLNHLGSLLRDQGELAEAEVLYREALAGFRQQLGNAHPDTLSSINNLALLLQAQHKLAEAEVLYREAVVGRKRQLGSTHPDTLTSIDYLAVVLHHQGRLLEAELLEREALCGRRQRLNNLHPDTLRSINNLAGLLGAQGKYTEAEELYREGTASYRQQFGTGHPDTWISVNNLGAMLKAQGKFREAQDLYREALTRRKSDNGHMLSSMSQTCRALLRAQAKLAEAVIKRELMRMHSISPKSAEVFKERQRAKLVKQESKLNTSDPRSVRTYYHQPAPRRALPASLLRELSNWPTLTYPARYGLREEVMRLLGAGVAHEQDCKHQCKNCELDNRPDRWCLECWRPKLDAYSYEFNKTLREQVKQCQELAAAYERIIHEVIAPWVLARSDPGERGVCYQFPPTLRIHPSDGKPLGRPHRDVEYGHQPGEITIWLPVTCILEPDVMPSRVCIFCGRLFATFSLRVLHQHQTSHTQRLPPTSASNAPACKSVPAASPVSLAPPPSKLHTSHSPAPRLSATLIPYTPSATPTTTSRASFSSANSCTSSSSCSSSSASSTPLNQMFPSMISPSRSSTTAALWAETLPGKSDFQPIRLHYGQLRLFYGVECLHGSVANSSGTTRVSLDFTVAPESCFDASPGVTYRHEMRLYVPPTNKN